MCQLVSCDSPRRVALKELARTGVEASGVSLTKAVANGDLSDAALLLEAGVHVERRDTLGNTPLAMAIDRRNHPMAFMLIAGGADVNASCPDSSTMVGRAVWQKDSVMASGLLSSGADGDGRVPGGERILPWAIREGRQDLVRALMENGADPHMTDGRGNSLLHVAMAAGRRDLMETLIELGADPGAMSAEGQSTIEHALAHGWHDVIPPLAAAGADPNARSSGGGTLLEQAVFGDDVKLATLLLGVGARPDIHRSPERTRAMVERVRAGRENGMLDAFLDHRAIDRADLHRWFWVSHGRSDLDFLRRLASRGVRPDILESVKLNPVELAAGRGDIGLLKLLLDFGFPDGDALMTSVTRGDERMVQVLLCSGVSPNDLRVPSIDTPLAAALRLGKDRVARVLLEEGADVSRVPPEGQSLFHLAVATGCSRAVKFMLDHGADPNAGFSRPVSKGFIWSVRPGVMRWALAKDRKVTPLMVASDSGDVPTAIHLMRAGAKSNVRTSVAKLWPINFASRRNDIPMMRLFLGQDPYREERFLEISLSEQMVRVFDRRGEELFATKVSTGKKGYATPTGEYAITNKYRNWTSTLYHASMPYFQRLSCGDFGLHRGYVPNYPASHGCIRVPSGKASKLFSLTERGDRVRINP